MKKILIFLIAAAVLAAAVVIAFKRSAAAPGALFAEDTILYAGTCSPLKISTSVKFAEAEEFLRENTTFSEEKICAVNKWFRGLSGGEIGFRSVSIVPFETDGALVLSGTSKTRLADLLRPELDEYLSDDEAYRGVDVCKFVLDELKFTATLYISSPVKKRTVIASSRKSLMETIDRIIDGGRSLADNEEFAGLLCQPEMRGADTILYVDISRYYDLLSIRKPVLPSVAEMRDLIVSELRLNGFVAAMIGTRFDFSSQTLIKVNEENPFYRQLQNTGALNLPYVPATVSQFSFFRLADLDAAANRFFDILMRIAPIAADFGVNINLTVNQIPVYSGVVSSVLNGEFGVWRNNELSGASSFCVYAGLKNAAQLRALLMMLPAERDGDISFMKGDNRFCWNLNDERLLISNSRALLRASLNDSLPSLTDTEEFKTMANGTRADYSAVSYSSHFKLTRSPRVLAIDELAPLLNMLSGLRKFSVSTAENGMIKTQSKTAGEIDRDDLLMALRPYFRFLKEQADKK